MIRQNSNVFSVILDDEAQNALGFAAGTLVTDANLPKGAIAVVDMGNRFLTAAAYAALTSTAKFRILQGKGAGKAMMKSPELTKGNVTITSAAHKAAVQQVTTIGYNGTTGALPVANDTAFHIKLRKNDNDAANRSQPMSLFAGPVKTDASGTQEELALALAKSFNKNFYDEPANGYAKAELICSNAGAVTTAATGTLTATNGSVTVTGTGATILTEFSAGDYVRFGTALTSPVYKVVTATDNGATGTLVLDRPYTGATGTFVAGAAHYITAAGAAAANFGIVITGVEAPFDVNKFRNYYANRFTVSFSDESTLISHTQGARNGNGVWQQVALDEYMSYGFEGQNEMLAVPATMRDQEVKIPGVGTATAATSKYSVVTLSWTESVSGIVHGSTQKGQVILYLNLDATANLGGAGSTGEEVAGVLVPGFGTSLDE
jgi:hypothetical protein